MYHNALSEVITYTPPKEIKPSEWFEVKAQGKSVFVYDSDVAPFAMLDTDQEILLEISSKKFVSHLDVRSAHLGFAYTFTGNTIWVKVSKPCQFTLEINKNPSKEPLLVFVNPVEKNKPSKSDTNVLYFETGKIHKAGQIELKSNKTVYIEGGA